MAASETNVQLMTFMLRSKTTYSWQANFRRLPIPLASSKAARLVNSPQLVRSRDLKGHVAGVLESTVRNIGPPTDDSISLNLPVKHIGPSCPTISAPSAPLRVVPNGLLRVVPDGLPRVAEGDGPR